MIPKPGRLLRQKRITADDLRSNPTTYYVFGDNMLGRGRGGQAAAMRGEPNAIGVPTKRAPGMRDGDFFTDADWDDHAVQDRVMDPFRVILGRLFAGHDVVIPADGLGTGLAQLPTRAPRIHAWIEGLLACLTERFP